MRTFRKVARSATSGRFITAREAHRRPQFTVVETISYPSPRRFGGRRHAARHITEEKPMERSFKAGKDQTTAGAKKHPSSKFKAGKDI